MITGAQSRRFDRAQFFADLGYQPHPGQLEVHQSRAPRRVVACGVRWGKSRCAALEGLAAAMEPNERTRGWVVAPTYDLADKVFREIVIVVAEHLRHRIVTLRESDKMLVLRNLGGGLSEIRGKSADNPVSLLGEGLNWTIVDEAARLKPEIWESHLSQRLIDKRGWALCISTPRGKGWFHDLFQRGQRGEPGYASWNHPSWTNPHVDRELIEAQRLVLPERVFEQEYLARFGDGAGCVFRYVRECATGLGELPIRGATYYAGVDLAKVEDFTVLVVVHESGRVVAWERFNKIDWALQLQRIAATVKRYDARELWVDSTGVGEPLYESLRMSGLPAKPYQFTAASKAALVNNIALLLEQRRVVLPRREVWPELVDELEAFEYSVSDAGNVRSRAPSGQHDDCVMGLGLALWPLRPTSRGGGGIVRLLGI